MLVLLLCTGILAYSGHDGGFDKLSWLLSSINHCCLSKLKQRSCGKFEHSGTGRFARSNFVQGTLVKEEELSGTIGQ